MIVGITTAPRKANYLPRTIASLKRAGFDEPEVFEDTRSFPIENWKRALKALSEKSDTVLLCQDDVVFCRGIRAFLERELWPTKKTGCVSLYKSAIKPLGDGLIQNTRINIWGCCALVFPSEVAKAVVSHPKINPWKSRKKIDIAVGTIMKRLGLQVWNYSPSLAQHIGDVSTLGHSGMAGRRVAADFVGEDYDVNRERPIPDGVRWTSDGKPRTIN